MKIENVLKVIGTLCTGMPSGYNINQLSRLSGVDVATTYRTLKAMEKNNEVLKEKRGNNIFYRPNLRNSVALKYCELASIERRKGLLSKNPNMAAGLLKLRDAADSVVVFGSVARSEPRPRDIDVLLLSGRRKPVRNAQNSMPPSFSPIYMGFREFGEKIRKRERLAMEILKDGVVASGEGRYWEAVRDAL